jgi:hypothetical protein
MRIAPAPAMLAFLAAILPASNQIFWTVELPPPATFPPRCGAAGCPSSK